MCTGVLQVMSRELFDYLVREKIADGPLIAKWRKPGFEILCSMLAIQKGNHNFGTTSHCRVRHVSTHLASDTSTCLSTVIDMRLRLDLLLQVPLSKRAGQQRITPDVQIGCISCASGDGRFGGPVWCGLRPAVLLHLA